MVAAARRSVSSPAVRVQVATVPDNAVLPNSEKAFVSNEQDTLASGYSRTMV